MRGERAKAIESYVEAVRGVRSMETAIRDEGTTPARAAALDKFKADVRFWETRMSGGDKGKAMRRLAPPKPEQTEQQS